MLLVSCSSSEADATSQEFVSLLSSDEQFSDPRGFGIIFGMGLTGDAISQFIAEAVCLVASQAVDFYRRIQKEMVDKFPLQLAWLVFQPAEMPCEFRKELAISMLLARHSSDLNDDALTFKIRLIFEVELCKAAREGTLDIELWQLVTDILSMTVDNTQDNRAAVYLIDQVSPRASILMMYVSNPTPPQLPTTTLCYITCLLWLGKDFTK